MLKSFIVALALLGVTAHAYIPPAKIIVEKMTKKTVSGGWRATFHTQLAGAEGVFEEIWTIRDGETMRLKVRGISENNKGFSEDIVYREGNRYRVKETGELVYIELSPRYFERLFHFQTIEGARTYLETAGILQPEIKEDETSQQTIEPVEPVEISAVTDEENKEEIDEAKIKFAYKPDPRVRLDRVSGFITYAIGDRQTLEQKAARPAATLWVEQDRYDFKKLRLPSGSEVTAEPYKKFGRRWFPRSRTVKWRGQKIIINTVRLDKINVGPKTRKFLMPSSIEKRPPQDTEMEDSSLEISLMSEFYQRFR